MDNLMNLANASVYVGTYGKYNNGSLDGKWMKLSDYSDKEEFLDACYELHSDENDELMFQDYENIPKEYIGESWISEKIWKLLEMLNELDDDEKELFCEWLESYGDENSTVEDFRDAYLGTYRDIEEFVRECGYGEELDKLPDWLYIDWDKVENAVLMDCNYIDTKDGYLALFRM